MKAFSLALAYLAAGCTAAHVGGDSGTTGAGTSGGAATACLIDGTTYPADVQETSTHCQICDPSQSTTSWSPGAPCSATQLCVNQACVNAACVIDAGAFLSGAQNPENPCEVCNPLAAGPSKWTPLTGPGDGGCVCLAGRCVSACFIDGGVVDAGAFEPGTACAVCAPALSTAVWSPFTGTAPSGVCPSGDVCDAGACACGPDCAGKCPQADDGCGGRCPMPDAGYPGCTLDGTTGCCGADGVCGAGGTTDSCAVGGACAPCDAGQRCISSPEGGYLCCTPGAGCGLSCGSPAMRDECGDVCPYDCPTTGCCDDDGGCHAGTASSACGAGAPGLCLDCGPFPCVDQACGCNVKTVQCDTQQCLTGTQQETTCWDGGKSTTGVCQSSCCHSGKCTTCVDGTCSS